MIRVDQKPATGTTATSSARTLGVLGGMGPTATAEFLRLLSLAVPARSDQEHPRIVMLSEPSIPERTGAILAGSDAPLLPIRAGLEQLASWGADLLVVPCNTAHAFIDRLQDLLPVPVVHIADATLRAAMRTSPEGGWLAATTGTVHSGIYQRRAAELGYRLLVPDEPLQAEIHRSGVLVKANRLAEGGTALASAVRGLWQRHDLPVLTACTELPLAYQAAGLPGERSVSSLAALVTACVAELLAPQTVTSAAGARS
ncbi:MULTISPECIES: aspartate/glutamate racemase family protein [Streptomyces]|uniref:aspartate/glutamate racemase family protein n=1 Tax=Streptomyces albidoflavus TaxID=1886 RepID=UPI001F0B867D|nr:amino acid racemase [Streptomyces albidoflavus]